MLDPSFRKTLINTIPPKPSKKWDFSEDNAQNVDTSSGGKIKPLLFAVTQSTIINKFSCKGQYTFIGKGCGIGLEGKKLTYKGAWDSFEKSLSTARIPCKTVSRYPVIARWRNDVEYVAAGIYCFQPYCVTG